ncbi:tetratricopeptide repeat protein [Pseudoroseicyclus aestuarii]|uniref:Ancillary SecYEG translocon subunit/Cell division coordinator CpoB TPR domain-containing protein n=1 Tax=Pseudoroseicyclus aestuarii TaxID=1795041 RepID=A0A318T1I3_9RHOB|nr:tetratricopeptide repeat protein [Pseudoroseicyclus aestuarii]PYE84044.1 hypothetical protein DFP88_103408 [Pseudoroseicyclus aestuarii]
MSNPDSFIDEVTEEVRRDRLFRNIRRWGWLAVLIVVVIVAAAAWAEWRDARREAAAQALGDDMLTALQDDDAQARADALGAIEAPAGAEAVAAMLAAAELQGAGEPQAAAERLNTAAADGAAPALYRDLAALKAQMVLVAQGEGDIQALEALAQPGAPFRMLALEQMATQYLAQGETTAATEVLTQITEDAGTGSSQRERAQGLLVALQGPSAAPAAEEAEAEAETAAETDGE